MIQYDLMLKVLSGELKAFQKAYIRNEVKDYVAFSLWNTLCLLKMYDNNNVWRNENITNFLRFLEVNWVEKMIFDN